MIESNDRTAWTGLSDEQLLQQCEVDTYRASGPGGQKRNKTSSAVRIRHLPSGLIVIAEESRSQHENRVRALRRLRQAFYLNLRNSGSPETLANQGAILVARNAEGRLRVGRKDARYWPAAGVVLDVLASTEARIGEAAKLLGVSTGNLVDFLSQEPRVWGQVNQLRARFGVKALHG
jgi:hypothetical protein